MGRHMKDLQIKESEKNMDAAGYERLKSRRENRFPRSLFFIYLGVLLLMSGIHTGLIVLMNEMGANEIVQTIVPIVYWTLVATALAIFTSRKIFAVYDDPMKDLAEAARKVANGDFSVYVPTIHTADKLDYLDLMIIDFNKMVEELSSIETLKTDFFSNVSHEMKTPLAVIQNNAELMRFPGTNGDKQRECAENIWQASRRMSSLITNMLKLNKLEKQTIKPVPQTYDLCAQLCDCALQFEPVWEKKEIEFDADMEERVMIDADEGLLELVWTNLLSNAFKFTPQGGRVRLSEYSDANSVTVSVTDSGCGMDSETVSQIFDKFYQGDTSHATEGNGLGLALVKRILQLSDADISVVSRPGEGAEFTVRLNRMK